MKRILICGLILLATACLISSANAASFFSFTSSSTAWVGGGKTTNLTTVSAIRSGNAMRFLASGYELEIIGPGSTLPKVGFYPGATRYPFMGSGPGLSFTSPGRGDNTLTGWFHVLQADFDQAGQVTAFAVDFVQHDEGNVTRWNRGSIRYNSDITAPGLAPSIVINKAVRTNGLFQFTLSGPADTNCIIQVSSNLVNWLPLTTNAISPVGLLTVSDPDVAGQAPRFYRAVRTSGGGGGGGSGAANDQFANRTQIPSSGGTVTGSNTNATKEANEPNHANSTGGKSVWWSWTAPASGIVSVSLDGTSFDTLLGVYQGSTIDSLTSIAQDDDGGAGFCSRVVFTATAGVTYQIAVDGYLGSSGNINLTVKPGLLNDAFAQRLQMTGTSDFVVGCNVGATWESGEPYHWETTGEQSVWWRWQAPISGNVTISTTGSSFDTILAAYTGTSVAGLSLVANNDDYNGYSTSLISFYATAGTVYTIAVDGYGSASGFIVLSLQQ